MRGEVVFVGHGSPMNVLLDNEWTRTWRNLPNQLNKPKAIIAVSAHWYIDYTAISNKEEYKQIYDMYGFPEEVYKIDYKAKSDKQLEKRIRSILGDKVKIDNQWGLDHGLWSVLRFMYPHGDIPMVVISIDAYKTPREHFEIARELRSLREEGYMVLTSGNIVHNLRLVNWDLDDLTPDAKKFDDIVFDKVRNREYEDLIDYVKLPSYQMAIPTPDHYIPLIYALGFLFGDEETLVFNRGGELGTISMTSYIFK